MRYACILVALVLLGSVCADAISTKLRRAGESSGSASVSVSGSASASGSENSALWTPQMWADRLKTLNAENMKLAQDGPAGHLPRSLAYGLPPPIINDPGQAFAPHSAAAVENDFGFGPLQRKQALIQHKQFQIMMQRRNVRDAEATIQAYTNKLNAAKQILSTNEADLRNDLKELQTAAAAYEQKLAAAGGEGSSAAPAASQSKFRSLRSPILETPALSSDDADQLRAIRKTFDELARDIAERAGPEPVPNAARFLKPARTLKRAPAPPAKK